MKISYINVFLIVILFSQYAMCENKLHPIEFDMSVNSIKIDSDFKGMRIIIFGIKNDHDNHSEIIFSVKGPKQSFIVREKEKIMGFWINNDNVQFDDEEQFSFISSTHNTEYFQNKNLLKSLGINTAIIDQHSSNEQYTKFHSALHKRKKELSLNIIESDSIEFTNNTLFKISVNLPNKLPPGQYTVEAFLFNNEHLLGMQIMPFFVEKIGFPAFISNLSRQHPALHGLMCISIGITIGFIGYKTKKRL